MLWNVTHFHQIEIKFSDDLEQNVPSFSSKNVDEKFTFITECKDYALQIFDYDTEPYVYITI